MDELNKRIADENLILKKIVDENKGADKYQLLSELQKQASSISAARRYASLQKIEPACHLIKSELEQGAYKKVLIFGITKDTIETCRSHLYEFKPVTMYPKSSPMKVEKNLNKFLSNDNRAKTRVMICGIKSVPKDLDLSNVSFVFYVEEFYDGVENAMPLLSVANSNQTKTVFVRNFCLNNYADMQAQVAIRDATWDGFNRIAGELPRQTSIEDLF